MRAARGELIAFSDANAMWAPDALRGLAGAFADPEVALRVRAGRRSSTRRDQPGGLYWRYEMWLRAHESALHSITAGNGAIYAVRRTDYVETDPPMGHDLAFPFRMVKRGRRAVYVPEARATETWCPRSRASGRASGG